MSENLYAEKNRILYRQGGESLLMEPWGKNGLRVRACLMHDIEDTNAGLEETDAWPVQIVESKEELRITNGRITACLRLSPWGGPARIRFFNDRDKLLLEEISPEGALRRQAREYKPLNGDNYKLRVSFVSEPEEKIYGMGQYQQEKMNLKGCNLELAHRNSQASIPYYISSLGYGFFWNNPGIGEVHFGLNTTEWIAKSTRQMDYWITAEDAPKDLIESYTAVTGRVPKMPEYGLGFWQGNGNDGFRLAAGGCYRRKFWGNEPEGHAGAEPRRCEYSDGSYRVSCLFGCYESGDEGICLE